MYDWYSLILSIILRFSSHRTCAVLYFEEVDVTTFLADIVYSTIFGYFVSEGKNSFSQTKTKWKTHFLSFSVPVFLRLSLCRSFHYPSIWPIIPLSLYFSLSLSKYLSLTPSLCLSFSQMLVIALLIQHLIKVMLKKTVSLNRRCSRACVYVHMCTVLNAKLVLHPLRWPRLKESLEGQCICQSFQIRIWMRLPSNVLQF